MQMKKFSLFMFGVLMALPGFARDFTYTYQGTTLTYTVLNEDAKTCKTKDRVWQDASSAYEPKLYIEGQLVIPAVAKDGDTEYSVTSIGERSFVNCSALSSVLIPNSVTEIGEDAFSGCSGLNKLAYPSGLRGIYLPGIAYAYPREGAIIEDGVVYGPEKKVIYFVPISAKGGYVIPNSVTEIGEYAFRSCSGLYSVIIPNSVTKIGANAFRSCSVLQSVFIPTSVTEIGYGAFADCNILMKSAYPSGLSNPFPAGIAIQYPREGVITEDGVVYGADKGTIYFAPLSIGREFVIPNTVSTIEDNAFAYCYSLKSVIIPPLRHCNRRKCVRQLRRAEENCISFRVDQPLLPLPKCYF